MNGEGEMNAFLNCHSLYIFSKKFMTISAPPKAPKAKHLRSVNINDTNLQVKLFPPAFDHLPLFCSERHGNLGLRNLVKNDSDFEKFHRWICGLPCSKSEFMAPCKWKTHLEVNKKTNIKSR